MKKLYAIVLVLIACVTLFAGDYIQKTLPNGMEVITKNNENNESVALYCFVKTGSAYEDEYIGTGISHYLEHIVSGGSTTLHTEEEYGQMEQEIGATANAYTNTFTTCFQMTVPAEYVDKGLEMLSEHIMFCSFDSVEVTREREVIIKEFVYRSSPPPVKAYETFMDLSQPQSTGHYPVIGKIELYKQLTRDDLVNYYNKRYMPNNMIFVGVGNIDPDTLMTKVEETFKNYQRRVLEPVDIVKQPPFEGNTVYVKEFNIQQATGRLCTIIPDAWYMDCMALNVGMDYLLAKRTSPLNKALVEDLQLCNNVWGGAAYNMQFAADATIGFEAKDPSKMNEIVDVIDQYILQYSQSGITQEDIQKYIDRIQAAQLLSTPSPGSEASRIGIYTQIYGSPEYYQRKIDQASKLTPEDIYAAFQRHLVPKNRITYFAMPTGTSQLLEQQKEDAGVREEMKKIVINEDLTLIYRHNNTSPIIRAEILMPIYKNYGSEGDLERLEFTVDMLLRGSKKYSATELSEFMDDHYIETNGILTETGFKLEMKLLRNDFDELLDMIIDALKNPTFPQKEIQLMLEEQKGGLLNSQSWPLSVHNEIANKLIYKEPMFSLSNKEKWEAIKDLDHDKVQALYDKYFKASDEKPVVAALFGDLSEDEARKWAKEIYKAIPKGTVDEPRVWRTIVEKDTVSVNTYDFEPVNVNIFYPAPSFYSEDNLTMRLMEIILSGSSKSRLHKATRGTNNLAYWAYSDYQFSDEWGTFEMVSQTSLPKKDELIEVLKGEIERLKTEPVSQEELDQAIIEFDKRMQSMISENALPSYALYYEYRGYGYDYLYRMGDILRTITPEQIQQVANKYLNNSFVIITQPDEEMSREHE